MKFKYLGTAAAEGWPAMFCECDHCKRAKKSGGRNIRTRSQAVIDEKLLIDFPADTYMHVLNFGLDLTKIHSCIITHNHSDHFYPADFGMRRKGFAHLSCDRPLNIYGTSPALNQATEIINKSLSDEKRVLFNKITAFVPFVVQEYTITPLAANHDNRCEPVFFIISNGVHTILYANDTGYFPEKTWQYLKTYKPRFDFVSLDCTSGLLDCRDGHMGFSTNIEVKQRLNMLGCTNEKTIYCVNHFSHNGRAIYDELVPIAQKHDFLVSYDKMTIDL